MNIKPKLRRSKQTDSQSDVSRRTVRSDRSGRLLAENQRGPIRYLPQWLQAGTVAMIAITLMLSTTGAFNRTPDGEVTVRNVDRVALEADEIKSAQAASIIAQRADIIVRNNVLNLSDTLNAQVNFISDQELNVNKPTSAVIDQATNREVISYVAVEGDTVSELAGRFNVSSDTIRWANDISGDAISVGKELRIPPQSGVFHTVRAADTAESLANKYEANQEDIISFNNAEVDGLPVDQEIFIPGGVEPAPIVPVARTSTSSGGSSAPVVIPQPIAQPGVNTYARGYCTWWAADRRAAIGRPIPMRMGHAISWGPSARAAGYTVDGTPQVGDVAWKTNGGWGGYGHVAFVEEVRADGTVLLSEMNYAGWNVVSTRVISGSQIGGEYQFIH